MTWFIFAITASLCLTMASLAQKDATHHEHAIQVGVSSSILMAAMALFLLPFCNFNFSLWLWPVALTSGVIVTFGFYYCIKAFKALDASVASPLFNLGTIVVLILSAIFLNEHLSAPQLAGVALLIFGTYILELKKGHLLSPFLQIYHSKKIHLIIWSTLLYSIHAVLSKYILAYIEPLTYLLIESMVMAGILVVIAFVKHEGFKSIKKGFQAHKAMIIAIALFNSLSELFIFLALSNGEASLVVPVVRTWTLFVVILGGTFLKEGHLKNRITATAVMLIGIFIIYL